VVETEQPARPAPIPQLLHAVSDRIPSPVRFCLYLVLASTPLLAISAEVFGVVSLRTVRSVFLLPLLGILAVLVVFKPNRIDRTAFAGFTWGLVACAGYDAFRLPSVYGFHLWGDFFGRIGGWATGTSSDYLAGYLWRYLGDGAGIGVVVFILAAALGAASWPRRRAVGLTVAFAVCPVWAGLVLTDGLAPAGRALFPLNATTLVLSLAGHLVSGLPTWSEIWCDVENSKSFRSSRDRRIFPGHRLKGASALHNYLASIFTAPSVTTWSDMSGNTRKTQVIYGSCRS
jgi:hypothetical protein